MILRPLSKNRRKRLTPVIPQVIEILRRRGILVRVDDFPRLRLVDDGSLGSIDLQSVLNRPVISDDQLERLEAFSIFAKRSLRMNIISRNRMVKSLSVRNRDRYVPYLNDFLNFVKDVEESLDSFSLNDLFKMMLKLVTN